MSILQSIQTHLKNIPAVTAAFGDDPLRVWGSDVPERWQKQDDTIIELNNNENLYPYTLVQWAGGDPERFMGGHTGTVELYYDVDVYSKTGLQAEELYLTLWHAMDVADHTQWGTMFVDYSEMTLPSDGSFAPTDGGSDSLNAFGGRLMLRVTGAV